MTSRSSPRSYLAEVLSWRILKESWDAAQSLIAAVLLGATVLTAVLHFRIGPVPWWLPIVPFGGWLVIALFRNGYVVYQQVASQVTALEQEVANLRDPELTDRVLGLDLTEESTPAVGINAGGHRLGLRLTAGSDRGLLSCKIKVEALERQEGSTWGKAQGYGQAYLQQALDIPSGASETWWLVTVIFASPDDPRASLGPIPSLTKGTWRTTLRIQAYGWRARYVVVEFALIAREPPFSYAPELRWACRSPRTIGGTTN